MSFIQVKLCSKLLKEHFGEIVTQVAEILMRRGADSLDYTISSSKLPKKKVQEALCVLATHNLLKWEEIRPRVIGYSILIESVLFRLRFSRCIHLIREVFGEESEMIIDFLFKHGQATASQIITYSTLKLLSAIEGEVFQSSKENKLLSVYNAFEKLVSNHFIQRVSNQVNSTLVKEEHHYKFGRNVIDMKSLTKEIEQKEIGSHNSSIQLSLSHPDSEIFWKLNHNRFNLELRDRELKKSVSIRLDPMAKPYVDALLKVNYRRNDPWVPSFQPVMLSEISNALPDAPHVDQYMKIISENFGAGLQKVGDAGGGEFVLSVSAFIFSITTSVINNIVQERFGSKGLRIFRIIRENKMIEQDHIVELSMVDKNKLNFLTHRMLLDNFIKLYEVRKGPAPAYASKSIYLFYVDLPALVRMLLEWFYKAIINLMEKRENILDVNKRLLEKKARVEMIIDNLRESGGSEDQIKEVEEMFSPLERESAARVIKTEEKLLESETGIDEAIFIFQMFLFYRCSDDF